MTIELHVFPPSPRAFQVMAVANHLGIDTTLCMVDLVKGEQKPPEYAALNPNMRMPTLKDGDYVLWESNAIGQYLASKKPGRGLFPEDERARLDVTRWQFWDLAHWDPACAVFIFEHIVKSVVFRSGEADAAAIATGTELFHRAAKVLDAQLKGKKFVTGDTLTLADFSLGAPMNWPYRHYHARPADALGDRRRHARLADDRSVRPRRGQPGQCACDRVLHAQRECSQTCRRAVCSEAMTLFFSTPAFADHFMKSNFVGPAG